MNKILLISPDFNPLETKARALSSRLAALNFLDVKGFMVPLGLTTVAALTPDDVEVDIWDEAVHGLVSDSTGFEKEYDLAGVTGYAAHSGRVNELGRIFRKRGILAAVGGPGVSAEPEDYRGNFDILFIGEAEYTWPRFITDWRAGSHRPEYRQVSKVEMAHSPPPRWDKVAADMRHYLIGGVQTTRGCPFDCEFCDVIYLYGRQVRHKSIDQVLEEVSGLERLGVERIFFCDDDFVGNPRYAKELLRELIPLNRSFRHPLAFTTQISLNVAKDDEMLELMADANFAGMFIGIETINIESLIETNKPQNYKTDILADVRKIQSYGMPIRAGMIVGFDHDDTTIFDRQFEFLQEAGIVNPALNTLKAMTGTKLWIRLHKEGRVVQLADPKSAIDVEQEPGSGFDGGSDSFTNIHKGFELSPISNIIPKRMTRVELLSGYLGLVQRVRDWRNFEARAKEMISQMRRKPNVKQRRPSWRLTRKFLKFMLFSMETEARKTTLRLLLYTLKQAPFMTVRVMGLVVHQYAEVAQIPFLLDTIDRQIQLETTGGMKLHREQTVFFVPEGFKKPYKAIFPELYERIYQGLADKSRTLDALVEVIYDFLTRCGPGFQQFEEHDRTFLQELCGRTVAKENAQPYAGGNAGTGEVPNEMAGLTEGQIAIRLSRLADEVLQTVEQELRSFRT